MKEDAATMDMDPYHVALQDLVLNSKEFWRARGHGSPAQFTFSLDEAWVGMVGCGRLWQARKRPSAPFQYNSTLLSIRMLTGSSDRLDQVGV